MQLHSTFGAFLVALAVVHGAPVVSKTDMAPGLNSTGPRVGGSGFAPGMMQGVKNNGEPPADITARDDASSNQNNGVKSGSSGTTSSGSQPKTGTPAAGGSSTGLSGGTASNLIPVRGLLAREQEPAKAKTKPIKSPADQLVGGAGAGILGPLPQAVPRSAEAGAEVGAGSRPEAARDQEELNVVKRAVGSVALNNPVLDALDDLTGSVGASSSSSDKPKAKAKANTPKKAPERRDVLRARAKSGTKSASAAGGSPSSSSSGAGESSGQAGAATKTAAPSASSAGPVATNGADGTAAGSSDAPATSTKAAANSTDAATKSSDAAATSTKAAETSTKA